MVVAYWLIIWAADTKISKIGDLWSQSWYSYIVLLIKTPYNTHTSLEIPELNRKWNPAPPNDTNIIEIWREYMFLMFHWLVTRNREGVCQADLRQKNRDASIFINTKYLNTDTVPLNWKYTFPFESLLTKLQYPRSGIFQVNLPLHILFLFIALAIILFTYFYLIT